MKETDSMKLTLACLFASVMFLSALNSAVAVDYRVEPLNEAAPADELADEIAAPLNPTGVRVIRGTATTLCDIWLCKELATKEGFEPTPAILHPLEPGQFIGVVRFARKGADFRDQDIESGVYTLRYAHQPVDGAHVGTSLTRDFLLLLRAEADRGVEPVEYEELTLRSAEAAGSSHPALFSMQRVEAAAQRPSMRHDEERDWWIVGLETKTKDAKSFPIEFVVVGVAVE